MNTTVDLHSSHVPSTEQRNHKKDFKSCYVLQDHYDGERYKIVFHKTTPELQDQDQDQFFWSQTGLVLRPTVSDLITVIQCTFFEYWCSFALDTVIIAIDDTKTSTNQGCYQGRAVPSNLSNTSTRLQIGVE